MKMQRQESSQSCFDGQVSYQVYRDERYVQKSKKISDTISKKNLPSFAQASSNKTPAVKQAFTTKDMSNAQQEMEIAVMRGMALEEILAYDLLPSSVLFEGKLPAKPQKAQLMTSLEAHLHGQLDFSPESPLETDVIVDFMSKIRQFSNVTSFRSFGELIFAVIQSGKHVCVSGRIHLVFDSDKELSLKTAERLRRTGEGPAIDLAILDESIPIPQ